MEKKLKKKIIYGVIAAGVILAILLLFSGGGLSLQAARVKRGDIKEFVMDDAKTRLHNEYEIDMPFSGDLFRPQLDVGDMVTSGQVIARIDDYKLKQEEKRLAARIEELFMQREVVARERPKDEDIATENLKLHQAEIAVDNALKQLSIQKLQLEQIEREYERRKKLLEERIIGREEFDRFFTDYEARLRTVATAENEYLASQKEMEIAGLSYQKILKLVEDNLFRQKTILSQIEQVKHEHSAIRYDLQRVYIRAPVSGPILEKYADSDSTLPAGAKIYRIGDMQSIEIETDILSSDMPRIKKGQTVIVYGKALGEQSINGTVDVIYPAGFEDISTLGIEEQRNRILIVFDNSGIGLRPGLAVDIKIIVGERSDTLIIPEQAVFREQGKWYVYKVESGTVRQREVEVGLRNTDNAEIISGLQEGDTVIIELSNALQDGVKVKPVLLSR